MPPKKRDKEGETSKNQRSEAAKTDHDLFLQAFEKPTQIYRYLRVRNANSPIFLQRNLSYMRYRMSRTHRSRQSYEVNSLLEKVSKSLIPPALRGGFMTLTFLGFYDKKPATGEVPREPVKVETLLLKICHKKRKDTTTPVMTVTVGTSIVPTNPSEDCPPPKAPTVSISVDEFCEDQSEVKSYHLLLRVYNAPNNGLNGTTSSEQDLGEPLPKRRRTSSSRDEIKLFGTDLVVYDKQKHCLLGDGDYELLMDELVHPRNLPRKFPSWEQIGDISELAPLQRLREFAVTEFMRVLTPQDCNSFELFANGPTLKFKLEWSREQRSTFVDRPRTASKREEVVLDNNGNKENRQDRAAKKQVGEKKDEDKKLGKRPVIVYQFHYHNNSRQQTEPCSDLHCPWCSLDCGTLYSLLKHLKLCHARFTFTYTPLPNMARIDVAINESYDGSYTGSPHDVIAQPGGSAFSRNGPQIRTTVSNILVCHPKRLKPTMSEFMELEEESGDLQRSFITGHNRLYHHTVTCLPVHPKEMENDSEGENDPKWLQTKAMMMIDEFTDVNEGEKELMKMWNLHVMKEGYVGDCQVPLACAKFLEKKGKELLDKNLYRNFIIHMCSLFDYGLVSPVVLYKTIQQLHEMINESHAKSMRSSWEAQKEHWIKSGAKEKQNTPSHFKNQAPTVLNVDPSVRRKLYSPGSFKSDSPSRRTTQQQDDDEDEEDEDEEDEEEDEDEEEEEETSKMENQKSSSSTSSGSSSGDSINKKKTVQNGTEPEKKKSFVPKNGLVNANNSTHQKTSSTSRSTSEVGPPRICQPSSESVDSVRRKIPSLSRSSPVDTPSLKLSKSMDTVSSEPPTKKKIIVSQPNGKPQAVSSQNASTNNDLKRKMNSTGGSNSSTSLNSDVKKNAPSVNGLTVPSNVTKGLPTHVSVDSKKRLSLPAVSTSNTNSSAGNTAAINGDMKKKPATNGVSPSSDGKLSSNCTVEMVSISEVVALPGSSKVSLSCTNSDAKRKSSLGQCPIGPSTSQGDCGTQRRKSISTDSTATTEAGLVLLRRKSFSSNQSSESNAIQALTQKGLAS
ncbi:polycomb protein suz12-A isoform X1 [Frankliniella occidentalis]|uniref:Polycomb protein suz12-A isoform X1 n=1 Tax=Frankliniella occidentalis TaxID=133901 RepID=A0A6J1S6E3_FRAOC|nr:polycomb protein suz12-A isoform X1 [Frankliniella occidentalis]